MTGLALTAALPQLMRYQVPLPAAFLLLLLPASAMGATLPILVAAMKATGDRQSGFGWALGTMYGWNTWGAVAGALLVETAFIPSVGVTGSAWIAAALDALAAACAMAIGRYERPRVTASLRAGSQAPGAPMIAAFLAGAALLALEVIWFRFLSMFVLTTTLAMSVMLAVVLAGIAAGGLIAARVSTWSACGATFAP